MSRFSEDAEDGVPWDLWETIVSNALGGRKGQRALADMEVALLALPERKLISGHLAAEGAVCAVGALVAHRRAATEEVDLATIIDVMGAGVRCWCGHTRELHAEGPCSANSRYGGDKPCSCDAYELDEDSESSWETAEAGQKAGLSWSVSWHLAYLNDEAFSSATPEERYELMLAWVRRAQGKEAVAA